MWNRFIATASLLVFLTGIAAADPTSNYRLGTGDQIRVKVYEWRSAVGEVYAWTALNADFRVGPDGNVSLPLVGSVAAMGQTVEQLADTIANDLQKAVGLATRPQASVEIVEFRPVYVLGSVNQPGEYAYRPGMTVLQAISIAGGLFRVNDPSLLTFQRSSMTTAGELRVLRLEHSGLLARGARLQAELDGGDKIVFPPELMQQQSEPEVARLIKREQVMFTARRDALNSQLGALQGLKDLLNGEVASLKEKTNTMDQELALLKQELSNTTSLVKQGLAVAPREFTLRQTEIEAQGRRLDADAAILHAREDVGKADQAMIELRNKTRGEALTELAQVESKLTETAARIKTDAAIVGTDQEIIGPGMASLSDEQTGAPQYVIRRKSGDEVQQIPVDETSSVQPGDTVEVKRMRTSPQIGSSGIALDRLADPDSPPAAPGSLVNNESVADSPISGITKIPAPAPRPGGPKRH
jgi:protein involved in polysaccharide export with SLBB domain